MALKDKNKKVESAVSAEPKPKTGKPKFIQTKIGKVLLTFVGLFFALCVIAAFSDSSSENDLNNDPSKKSAYSADEENKAEEYVDSAKGSVGADEKSGKSAEKTSGKSSEKSSAKQNSGTVKVSQAPKPQAKEANTYTGKDYVVINGNTPRFTESERKAQSFETYSSLDKLGRCGVAYACIGRDLMPTTERGAIGSVKPSGWQTVKYDSVDGKYLYNRCHLIGWQLTAENANPKNLITGTRYFNVKIMLPFENMVADYIKETGNHVLYRVTPDFRGDELVARGIYMEAYSVEDSGKGICFYVYCYNIQPGISIDYADGSSALSSGGTGTIKTSTSKAPTKANTTVTPAPKPTNPPTAATNPPPAVDSSVKYIANASTKKFHLPTCSALDSMNESNKVFFYGSRDEVIAAGYVPCGKCHP